MNESALNRFFSKHRSIFVTHVTPKIFLLKFQTAFYSKSLYFQTCLVEIQVFAKISSGEAKTV